MSLFAEGWKLMILFQRRLEVHRNWNPISTCADSFVVVFFFIALTGYYFCPDRLLAREGYRLLARTGWTLVAREGRCLEK